MSASEEGGAGDAGRPGRQARDLQGLLRLSLQQQAPAADVSAEQAPAADVSAEQAPLGPERRRFLEAALADAANGISDMLRATLAALAGPDRGAQLRALLLLREYLDNVDIANEFETMGGLSVLAGLLESGDAEVRAAAAGAISDMLQNNPRCQAAPAAANLLPRLLAMVRAEPAPPARLTALQASSALLRDNPAAQASFCAGDGCGALLAALQSGQPRLQAKAAFLLSCLCSGGGEVPASAVRAGLVEQLAGVLATPHQAWHEHLLAALSALAADGGTAAAECRRPQLQLCHQLRERLRQLQGREEEQETLQHCSHLLQTCFTDGDEPDR